MKPKAGDQPPPLWVYRLCLLLCCSTALGEAPSAAANRRAFASQFPHLLPLRWPSPPNSSTQHRPQQRVSQLADSLAPPKTPEGAALRQLASEGHNFTGSRRRRALSNPCAALYSTMLSTPRTLGYLFLPPRAVRACTQSVKFRAARDLANLESTIKYFSHFYPLLHVAKRAPDSRVPSNFNVVGELRKLKSRQWGSAENFYTAMLGLVAKLDDAHTALRTNCPPFIHAFPLPLVAVVERGQTVIRVAPASLFDSMVTAAASKAPFRFNAAAYQGAVVVMINGQPAVKFLKTWSVQSAGEYHDPGQKFNSIFASPTNNVGSFALRSVNPGFNYMALRLFRRGSSKAENVRVPWLSLTQADNAEEFRSTDSYQQAFCKPLSFASSASASSAWQTRNTGTQGGAANGQTWPHDRDWGGSGGWYTSAAVQRQQDGDAPAQHVDAGVGGFFNYDSEDDLKSLSSRMQRRPIRSLFMRRVRRQPRAMRDAAKSSTTRNALSSATLISAQGDLFPVYLLKDKKTGVVVVESFAPDGLFGDPLEYFLSEAIRAFNLVNKRASQVIIDLSGNPGGYTQLGPWFIGLLMGTDKFPAPRSTMQSDFKRFLADTPFARSLPQSGSQWFAWSRYANVGEKPFTSAAGFYNPTELKRFGPRGVLGRYSRSFKEQLSSPLRSQRPQVCASPGEEEDPAALRWPLLLHVRHRVSRPHPPLQDASCHRRGYPWTGHGVQRGRGRVCARGRRERFVVLSSFVGAEQAGFALAFHLADDAVDAICLRLFHRQRPRPHRIPIHSREVPYQPLISQPRRQVPAVHSSCTVLQEIMTLPRVSISLASGEYLKFRSILQSIY